MKASIVLDCNSIFAVRGYSIGQETIIPLNAHTSQLLEIITLS